MIVKQYEVWLWPVNGVAVDLLGVWAEHEYDKAVEYAARQPAPGAYVKEFHFVNRWGRGIRCYY